MIVFIARKIKSLFLQGLFTIFPITVTIVILHLAYNLVLSWIAPLRGYVPAQLQHIPGVELALVLSFILLIGALLRFFILAPLVHRFEDLINRLPLVRVVYSAAKILADFFNVRIQLQQKKQLSS